jgi:hypothetical protein
MLHDHAARARSLTMEHVIRRIDVSSADDPPRPEWLVTKGLGGYASGTVIGRPTAAITGC